MVPIENDPSSIVNIKSSFLSNILEWKFYMAYNL